MHQDFGGSVIGQRKELLQRMEASFHETGVELRAHQDQGAAFFPYLS